MSKPWDTLPNGKLIRKVLVVGRQGGEPSDIRSFKGEVVDAYNAAEDAVVNGKRLEIYKAWNYATKGSWKRRPIKRRMIKDAVLALMAWDEASEIFALSSEQLKVSVLILPVGSAMRNAAILLLPYKEFLDAKQVG